jgi:hypothetical protein
MDWNGENGVAPFTRIDVFDTRGLVIHVDQELTYVYTPGDLSRFRFVHQGIEMVKQRLDDARRKNLPRGNPFLPKFKREDPVYAKIESLGSSTDLAELEKLAAVTDEEEAGLDSLREKVDALRSKSTDARVQLATGERDLYSTVSDVLKTIQHFDRDEYGRSVGNVTAAEERHVRATTEAFAGEPIPGVLGDAWRTFIESGEHYLQETDAEGYPQTGEPCIYCRQPLAEAAVELVRKYRDFCNSQFKQAVDDASNDRDTLTERVRALDPKRVKADLKKKGAALKEGDERPLVLTKSLDFIAVAQRLHEAAEQGKVCESDELDTLLTQLGPMLDTHDSELALLIKDLSQQAEERKQAFEEESAKLCTLEARLTLRELFPQIRTHVQSAKWADKANTILSRLSYTVAKSLTETSKVASQKLVNQNFEELFQAECQALKAPKVQLDFPGRKGQAARRKMLVPDHKLSEILSEGEQKAIALADFIAEASLRRRASPIVFDDPVTSLDYKRLQYVVSRLVELSKNRQVIIFTHNIWFTTELLTRFEKGKSSCSFYDVAESGGRCGVISASSSPRVDSVSKVRGRIKAAIQEAEAASGETQAALVERTYAKIRSICELITETELLRGVTERFRPNVMMTQLPNIRADRLQQTIAVVLGLWEKACRIIEAHSQPLETLNIRPSLDQLKQDWADLQAARDAYLRS